MRLKESHGDGMSEETTEGSESISTLYHEPALEESQDPDRQNVILRPPLNFKVGPMFAMPRYKIERIKNGW